MSVLIFVLAGLGEELVWRGYALPRVAALLGDGWAAWLAALLLVNVGFGLAHLYQGLPGVIEATVGGIAYGALYLATGRNLIAPMIAFHIELNRFHSHVSGALSRRRRQLTEHSCIGGIADEHDYACVRS